MIDYLLEVKEGEEIHHGYASYIRHLLCTADDRAVIADVAVFLDATYDRAVDTYVVVRFYSANNGTILTDVAIVLDTANDRSTNADVTIRLKSAYDGTADAYITVRLDLTHDAATQAKVVCHDVDVYCEQ